jgi:hypothetical protein
LHRYLVEKGKRHFDGRDVAEAAVVFVDEFGDVWTSTDARKAAAARTAHGVSIKIFETVEKRNFEQFSIGEPAKFN